MASLLESLLNNPVERTDKKRLSVPRRPTPTRVRELFEVFGALGVAASFPAVLRSIAFKNATPSALANAVLGRWLTNEELDALPEPYSARTHLRDMMLTKEFRRPLVRRVCEAFPEKRRLMHVRVPSCANRYTDALLATTYPVLRNDFGTDAFARLDAMSPYLGILFSRINAARAIALSDTHISSFMDPPSVARGTSDPLGWHLNAAPCRAFDLLFAAIRSPVSLALAQVNGTLTGLREAEPRPALRPIARKLGKLPGLEQPAEWKRLARVLLAEHLPVNPTCHALGDGTAKGAYLMCARSPIRLVAIERYAEWCLTAFEAPPYDPIFVSEPILQEAELTPQDHAAIHTRMPEDEIFYARFRPIWEASGVPAISGIDLGGAGRVDTDKD